MKHSRLNNSSSTSVTFEFLKNLPLERQQSAAKLTNLAIELSVQHQINPKWIIAIIWAETHFRSHAVSPKGALGPMQVMPLTAHFILRNLKKNFPVSNFYQHITHPENNIEMGIIYFKYLLEEFNYDFTSATVAYNMGPAWVKSYLKKNTSDKLRQHKYYKRVQSAYLYL